MLTILKLYTVYIIWRGNLGFTEMTRNTYLIMKKITIIVTKRLQIYDIESTWKPN